MADRNLEIIIKAQDFATKELNKIKKSISKVSQEAWKAWKWFSWMADKTKKALWGLAISFWAVTAAAWTLWGMFFNLADDVETTIGKAEKVFWEYFDDMDQFWKETAKAMGLTRSEFLKTTAWIQDLLIPMGFTREQATWMTQDMVWLSGALSEWSAWQYTAAEVWDIMAKAMLWEREQLKSLGIAISEEDVKTQMLIDAKKWLIFETEQQAKAIATQTLIMEKSTDAQTAYAEGADSLTRKKAEMTSTLWNLKETIATALIPAFHSIVTTIQPVIEKVTESIQKWFENKENVEKLTMVFNAIITVFGTVFKVIWTAIWWLVKLWEWLWYAAFKAIEMWNNIKQAFSNMKEWIQEFISGIKNTITAGFTAISSIATAKIQAIVASVMWAVEKVKGAYNSIKSLWGKIWTAYKNIGANIKTLTWADWSRANWWSVQKGKTYLVWERWPELFTASWSWNIQPNNQMWWEVNINMWWVTVSNEADENRLVEKMKKALSNEARYYNLWIS